MQSIYQAALEEVQQGRPVAVKTNLDAAGKGNVEVFHRCVLTGSQALVESPQLSPNTLSSHFTRLSA